MSARGTLATRVSHLAIGQVHDERIKARPLFRFENFERGVAIERVGRQSVNGLRRQRHDIAPRAAARTASADRARAFLRVSAERIRVFTCRLR